MSSFRRPKAKPSIPSSTEATFEVLVGFTSNIGFYPTGRIIRADDRALRSVWAPYCLALPASDEDRAAAHKALREYKAKRNPEPPKPKPAPVVASYGEIANPAQDWQ